MGGNDSKNSSSGAKRAINTTLSDILNFGPDSSTTLVLKPSPDETNNRLKKLVKDLQVLNARVERLSRNS